jgi:hypothetical protein
MGLAWGWHGVSTGLAWGWHGVRASTGPHGVVMLGLAAWGRMGPHGVSMGPHGVGMGSHGVGMGRMGPHGDKPTGYRTPALMSNVGKGA